jgi:hypothetical protein
VKHLRRVTPVKQPRPPLPPWWCEVTLGDFTTCVEEVDCKRCLASLSHAIIMRMAALGPS